MKLHVLIALAVLAQGCSKDENAHEKPDKPKVEQPQGGDGTIEFSARLTTNPANSNFNPDALQSWLMEESTCQIRSLYNNACSEQKKELEKQELKAKRTVGENASGSLTATYDRKTQTLKFTVDYQGLSGSPLMMHFHLDQDLGALNPIVQTVCGLPHGAEGGGIGHSEAPPTLGNDCPKGTSGKITSTYKLKGNTKLSPEKQSLSLEDEVNALMAGNLYLNIHTCVHPLGELNGSLTKL